MVTLGLSGVVWQNVSARTAEFGLRRAQGATAGDIRRQFLGELAALASGAMAAARWLSLHFAGLIAPVGLRGRLVDLDVYAVAFAIRGADYDVPAMLAGFYPRPPSGAHPAAASPAAGVITPCLPPARPILIVDDDPSVRASLALLLKQAGHRSAPPPPRRRRWSALARAAPAAGPAGHEFHPQDLGRGGPRPAADIRARRPALPVILMTAWGSIALAVEGMKAGASDFVTKPWTNPQLLHAVRDRPGAGRDAPRADGALPTREELDARFDFGQLSGEIRGCCACCS